MSHISLFSVPAMTLFATLLVSQLASANISPGLHIGLDQDQQTCAISIDSVNVGPVQVKDACFFETDGVGPWCDHSPAIKIHALAITGTITVAGQQIAIKGNDEYSRVEKGGEVSTFAQLVSGPGQGADVSIHETRASLDFEVALPTDLATGMSRDQIIQLLEDNRGSNYQKTYDSLYKTVKCSTQP